MHHRLAILGHWLAGRRNGVTAPELARVLFAPSARSKGQRHIEAIEEDGAVFRVRLAGESRPLFWPKSVDLWWLYVTIAEQWRPQEWHYYEVPETTVQPDDVVVDCGAAEGVFTLRVASRARAVYAVEPLPQWVDCLNRTFAGATNVHVLPYAVSDQPGHQWFHTDGLLSRLGTGGDVEVQVRTIDDLFFAKDIAVSYLKADLEGHDLVMLRGARQTIAQSSPRIAITTYHAHDHARGMMELLRGLNPRYRFHTKGIAVHGAPVMLHAWVDR